MLAWPLSLTIFTANCEASARGESVSVSNTPSSVNSQQVIARKECHVQRDGRDSAAARRSSSPALPRDCCRVSRLRRSPRCGEGEKNYQRGGYGRADGQRCRRWAGDPCGVLAYKRCGPGLAHPSTPPMA